MSDIILTPDQTELLVKLEDFLVNNKLSFGLYGPAGSGKSFTIGYFIKKNDLFKRIILTGTTNNACRVLEESLEKVNPNIDRDVILSRIECLLSDIISIKSNGWTNGITDKDLQSFERIFDFENVSYKITIDNKQTYINIVNYINKIQSFISNYKTKLEVITPEIISEFKNDIFNFINIRVIIT